MNKTEKEVQAAHLKDEKTMLKMLQKVFEKAAEDCEGRIRDLSARTDMENLQSIVYQKQYQEMLLTQLEGALNELKSGAFTTVSQYLTTCYENGYTGAMYSIAAQGIPVTVPIDPDLVVRALDTDSKLSKHLYDSMGESVDYLKRSIRAELSRGISNGSTWNEMAVKIAQGMRSGYNKAHTRTILIARTEGHRIQQASSLDACRKAQKVGADVVKQWDATLDLRTRPSHKAADGQTRELDEKFTVGGEELDAPGVGGSAGNVCNCRCCILQRARWALGEKELQTMRNRAAYFGLDKTEDFEEYKKKYLKLPDNADTLNTAEYDVRTNTQKLKQGMPAEDYKTYTQMLATHTNMNIRKLYAGYADAVENVKFRPQGGVYYPDTKELFYRYPEQRYIDNGRHKYSTLAHEYGHHFDSVGDFGGVHYDEIEAIQKSTGLTGWFRKTASASDEFLQAVRKDREALHTVLTDEVKRKLRKDDSTVGVQDAFDGLLGERIRWGHGDAYYDRTYKKLKSLKKHRDLQTIYKERGINCRLLSDVKAECRVYDSASEIWANIMSAETCGGAELESVKQYLPNSYEAMIKILTEVK